MNITNIRLGEKYQRHQMMMESLAERNFDPKLLYRNRRTRHLIEFLDRMALSKLDMKVKAGGDLTFEEAFSGMMLVLAATNNPIREAYFPGMKFDEALSKGTGYLQLMAAKEAFKGLAPEEVAGMVAAGTLDLVFRADVPEVVETCGMGGDYGWGTREIKTINASTLSAIVIASLGIPTFKHGSYGNTTRVGSTDIPVNFGANIHSKSAEEIYELFMKVGFWYSDAHCVKTLHYLSHLLMVETVNHIVGPMTVPISEGTRLYKVIGVNHHIHPEVVARAYATLHERGFINLGGAIVVCGLDKAPNAKEVDDCQWVAKHAFLDEVSPIATLVSSSGGGLFIGNFVLTDDNFGDDPIDPSSVKIRNTIETLMRANELALSGRDRDLARFLARNAALALCAYRGFGIATLADNYTECLGAILSGESYRKLVSYIEATGGKFRSWL